MAGLFNINSSEIPRFLEEPLQRVVAEQGRQLFDILPPDEKHKAERYHLKPYVPYPHQRIAPFNEDILAAHQRMGNIRAGEGSMGRANNLLNDVQYSFPQSYRDYMNPYSEAVVNDIARQGNRNFTESILPALEGKFVAAGQHGSSRHRELAARAARDIQSEILSRQNQAMDRNYQQAAQQFAMDQARKLQGSQYQQNQSAKELGREMLGISQLAARGEENRNLQQQGMNMGYENFQRQQNFPSEQIGRYLGNLQGVSQNYTPNTGQYGMSYADQAPQAPRRPAWENLANIGGRLFMSAFAPGLGGGGLQQ